jgi:pyridoxamine 5'-phosphate oxidase
MKDLDKQIKDLRKEFQQGLLEESHINADPHIQFGIWLKQAIDAKVNEPNAMSLSTVNENGKPSSRIVLLREFSENGYAFFTNYQSRKGSELTRNKNACLLFFWPELERQLRIEGTVEIHSPSASDNYFNSRPRNSRIGAWSSPQSSVINGRIELENLVSEFDKKYPNENVPRPEFWGGYLLKPNYYEFWQGRENRLHDRISYKITGENTWKIERLAP